MTAEEIELLSIQVTAWSTLGLAVLTLLVLIVYALTLWKLSQSVQVAGDANAAQNLLALLEILTSDDARDARGAVYKALEKNEVLVDDGPNEKNAAKVCSTFNSAALFVERMSAIDKKQMLEVWGITITRCFTLCKPLIDHRRKHIHPKFWQQFEELNDAVPAEFRWKGRRS